jgi:hypothetical protein
MVQRELQLYEESTPRERIDDELSLTVENPHVLFDVPLGETLREFIDLLDEYYDPQQAFENLCELERAPKRKPQFVFEQAIDEVLGLPSEYHEGCAGLATDNTLGPPPEIDSWEYLATTWLWHYLSEYNRQLHRTAPDTLADLEESVKAVQREGSISDEEIQQIVGHYLS